MRALKRLVKTFSPYLFFLQETHLHHSELEKIRVTLHFDGMVCVDCNGQFRSGGLVLMWKNHYVVNLQSCSLNHIDVTVIDSALNDE